jgi:hypothetical protein
VCGGLRDRLWASIAATASADPLIVMLANRMARVLAVHLGFHTLWVVLYCVSLLGVFILIPLVGWYNAFVLGFLGRIVLGSATRAALLGFIVFGTTGLVSGWVCSVLRPKSDWLFALISLFISGVLLVSVTWGRYKLVGISGLETMLPIPASSGSASAENLRWALKGESLDELPPHLAGKAAVISLAELQPSLSLLPKDFQLAGGPYVYCNLPSQIWRGLKQSAPKKYAILWGTQPDVTGRCLLVSVDLRTDVFSDEFVAPETLNRALAELESAIRRQTGEGAFMLPK